MEIPKLPTFPNFVKYPLQTLLYLLLAYFIYKEFNKKDECSDLRAAYVAQAKRIEALESKIDNLTWSIAVKSGIINELRSKQDTSKLKNDENVN